MATLALHPECPGSLTPEASQPCYNVLSPVTTQVLQKASGGRKGRAADRNEFTCQAMQVALAQYLGE